MQTEFLHSPGLIVFAWCLLLQTNAQDLRVIQGELYDFSPLEAQPAPSGRHSPYVIVGRLVSLTDYEAVVRPGAMYYLVPTENPRTMDRASAAGYNAAQRASANGPLDAIDLLRLPFEARQHFTEIQGYDVLIKHYRPSGGVGPDVIKVYAVPVSKVHHVYDCGIPVKPDVATNFTTLHVVQWNAIVEQPATPGSVVSRARQSVAENASKAFTRHLSQASNNMPYSQFLVGLDYLNGTATATNQELGLYWIKMSAEAGSPEAKGFLKPPELRTVPTENAPPSLGREQE